MDMEVRALLGKARQQGHYLLQGHRSALDALAKELLLHETVNGERLDELLARESAEKGSDEEREDSRAA